MTALVEGTLNEHENLTQHNLNCGQEWLAVDNFKLGLAFEGYLFFNLVSPVLKQQLAHLDVEIVRKMIEEGDKNSFDLVISETHSFVALNQFAEFYNCPIVMVSPFDTSTHVHYAMGNEVNPTMVAESNVFSYDANSLTFVDRLKVTLMIGGYCVYRYFLDIWFSYTIKSYFPHAKESLTQVEDRIALVLTNTHQALGFVRPETGRIHIGFLDMETPQPLPEGALRSFVENSEKGIILVNFGSVIKTSSFPSKTLEIFFKVFENLQYRVVWKVDDTSCVNNSKNIFLSNWVPQNDLLGHPKIKLFITHGGLNSVQESIDQSVPMLIIPVVGDQVFNARRIEQKDCGFVLLHQDLSEKTLTESIKKALEPKYKKNVEKLREIIYSYPMSSRETIVYWIEHTIKHKGLDYMRYAGRNVTFFRKYYVDMMIYLMVITFIAKKLLRMVAFIRQKQPTENESASQKKKTV